MLRDLFSLFPAYAGVIPLFQLVQPTVLPFPRICGGDPVLVRSVASLMGLFPAYAGVIPLGCPVVDCIITFPRICGGDPTTRNVHEAAHDFSPHMRG